MNKKINQQKIYLLPLALLCCWGIAAQSPHHSLRQGEESYDLGDYGKARNAYSKAANNTGYFNAGNAAMQQNDLEAAVEFYTRAVEKSSSPALKTDALYNLGTAYLRLKKYGEAIKAFEASLRISSNRPDAQKNLQIAKRLMQEPPPTPDSPPPPPPPPPQNPPPRRYYLDQATESRQKEIPPADLPPETARQMLAKALLSQEQNNARAYRELSPANQPSRLKKDW